MLSRRRLQVKISHRRGSKDSRRRLERQYTELMEQGKFRDMMIYKGMLNKELLGIIIRDDKLLNLLAQDEEAIRLLWKEQIGEGQDLNKGQGGA